VWFGVFGVAYVVEAIPIVFLAFVLYTIYANLDHRGRDSDKHSAYSVFNKDQKALSGTMQANELDRLMRGQYATSSTFFDESLLQVLFSFCLCFLYH
jgi:hypothetical protein